MLGEGGDDSVSAGKEEPDANAADVVDGGPGFDAIPAVDADYNRGFDDDVVGHASTASPTTARRARATTSSRVEKLRIVANHATVVGTAGADDIFVDADSSLIRGLGGNDKLVAYDGNDTIEGGDGDDFLEGGFGNDVLDGGAGVDQFNGDRTESNVIAIGNDQIRARDGNAEQVSCGIGSGHRAGRRVTTSWTPAASRSTAAARSSVGSRPPSRASRSCSPSCRSRRSPRRGWCSGSPARRRAP